MMMKQTTKKFLLISLGMKIGKIMRVMVSQQSQAEMWLMEEGELRLDSADDVDEPVIV